MQKKTVISLKDQKRAKIFRRRSEGCAGQARGQVAGSCSRSPASTTRRSDSSKAGRSKTGHVRSPHISGAYVIEPFFFVRVAPGK